MKKRNLFLTLGLALTLGAGVAGGLSLNRGEVKEVEAAGKTYYLVGESNAASLAESDMYGAAWNADSSTMLPIVDGGDARTIKLYAGDQFKYVVDGGWDGALGNGARAGLSGTNGNLFDLTKDNVTCKTGGSYKVSIAGGKIHINPVSATYATIYAHLYDGTATYVYAYDSVSVSGQTLEPLGVWPGMPIGDYTTEALFNKDADNLGGIGKISLPYSNLSNTKLILNNNNGSQTGNITLVNGSYYPNTSGGTTSDANKGAAAKVVYDIDVADVCSLTKIQASDLLGEYTALGENVTAKGYVENTRWNGYSFAEVSAYLTKVANAPAGTYVAPLGNESNGGVVIIIAAVSISLVAVASIFVIRRRKEQE